MLDWHVGIQDMWGKVIRQVSSDVNSEYNTHFIESVANRILMVRFITEKPDN